MEIKSLSQAYYMLSVGDGGQMNPTRTELSNAGLVAAAYLELRFAGAVKAEKKRVSVVKPLPRELSYLEPLYRYLAEKERSYTRMLSDHLVMGSGRRGALLESVGRSLVAAGAAEEGKGGFFGNKTVFIPKKAERDQLVGRVREMVLSDKALSREETVLLVLLKETKNLGQYFSKYEEPARKDRLKALRKNPRNELVAAAVKEAVQLIDTAKAAVLSTYSM